MFNEGLGLISLHVTVYFLIHTYYTLTRYFITTRIQLLMSRLLIFFPCSAEYRLESDKRKKCSCITYL